MMRHRQLSSLFVTIHDIAPSVIPQTREILSFLQNNDKETVFLLVIPSLFQNEQELLSLRKLLADFPLATLVGHGWKHCAVTDKSLYHRLHSLLVSRQAAEHLSLTEDEVAKLIEKSFYWFADNGFAAPEFYVPPAWAMGNISRDRLQELPFRYYEYQHGIYDSDNDQFIFLPLTGFEADSTWRKCALSFWNKINMYWASRSNKCLRMAIHPFDLQLKLADDLLQLISRKYPTIAEPTELFSPKN